MTLIPFARLVREMRILQKIVYSIPDDLDDDLDLIVPDVMKKQRDVDNAVRDILGQPTLFDRDDEAI